MKPLQKTVSPNSKNEKETDKTNLIQCGSTDRNVRLFLVFPRCSLSRFTDENLLRTLTAFAN